MKTLPTFVALTSLLLTGCVGSTLEAGTPNEPNDPVETCPEASQSTYYSDQDGDGYGDPDSAVQAC